MISFESDKLRGRIYVNKATGTRLKVTGTRTKKASGFWGHSTEEVLLEEVDSGFRYGWIETGFKFDRQFVPESGVQEYGRLKWAEITGQPAPKPTCDCGGAKANTTHSSWCSTVS
jgi:hypothetical protein